MNDEFRGHDPRPTEEEREWMSFDPLAAAGRAVAILAIAFAIGGYVSYAMEAERPAPVARAGR